MPPTETLTGNGRRRFVRRVAGYLAAAVGGVTATATLPGRAVAASTGGSETGPLGLEDWIGQIVQVPYNFAPRGFVFCEGQQLQVSQNQALFSLIGNFYGGDGRTTFMLPDTRPLEEEAKKKLRASRPPFRYAIAIAGNFTSRA